MTTRKSPKAPAVDPADFPALRDFVRGYLHQDFADEYGSAVGALVTFVGDAATDEAAALRADWERFRAATAELPFSRVRRLLADGFGSGYAPASADELAKVFAPLTGGEPGS